MTERLRLNFTYTILQYQTFRSLKIDSIVAGFFLISIGNGYDTYSAIFALARLITPKYCQ